MQVVCPLRSETQAKQAATRPGVALDAHAWRAGFDAGRRGNASTACPHASKSDKSLAWSSGFIEGRAARLRIAARSLP